MGRDSKHLVAAGRHKSQFQNVFVYNALSKLISFGSYIETFSNVWLFSLAMNTRGDYIRL